MYYLYYLGMFFICYGKRIYHMCSFIFSEIKIHILTNIHKISLSYYIILQQGVNASKKI